MANESKGRAKRSLSEAPRRSSRETTKRPLGETTKRPSGETSKRSSGNTAKRSAKDKTRHSSSTETRRSSSSEARQSLGTESGRPIKKHRRWPSRLVAAAGVAFCLALAVFMLYPALREYYIASREHEQLVLEYAAVMERNDKISEQIAHLQTPEGIEDRAREQFGWVKKGEEAVNITGLRIADSSTALPAAVASGSLKAESTWWTNFLDFIFNVDTTEPIQETYDPFTN